ncbi:MAG: hypothetical protein HQL76_07400 [Magnetococcales bacterium]|nr:hypothetical protein [Magnetococcales bacterium]
MSEPTCIIQPAITVPRFLKQEIIAKLAYVDPLVAHVRWHDGDTLLFRLRRTPEDQERLSLLDKVQRTLTLLVTTTREPPVKILEDRMDQPLRHAQDPMGALMDGGHVFQTGDGMYSLGPRVASLCRYFEERLFALGMSVGGQVYRFPAMIPARFLEKIHYFKNFPHSLGFVAHLKEDLDIIERFARETRCTENTLFQPHGSFSRVQNLLSPTVCHNFYLMLSGRTLGEKPMIATAHGNCFRYESINMHSLERLWNFTMWEVIFVGSSREVKELLTGAGQKTSAFLQELGLAYRLENANDPFFIREFGSQSGFQQIYELKYEYRALLPFKNETLSIGSRNYHIDFFGRGVEISLADGSPAHSGCIGLGLERLAFAFLAQFGINPDHWPAQVRAGTHDMEGRSSR